MPRARLGPSELEVSRLVLGGNVFGWTADEEASYAVLDAYVAAGGNAIDLADSYPHWAPGCSGGESEEIVGRWMGARGNRSDIVICTKVGKFPGNHGLSRAQIMAGIDGSLRRLQTDYIDLYQVHFYDPNTPIDETLQALDDVVRSGKVRYVGCSNFLAYQLARAVGRSEVLNVARFESVQPRYNLLFREIERELLPLCNDENLAVIPYNPLAGGFLTGKHTKGAPTEGTRFTLGAASQRYQERYWHDAMFDTVEAIKPLAAAAGMTMAQLSVAWVLANPTITSPIIGASRPEQLADAIKAVSTPLPSDLKAELDVLTHEYRFGDHVQ